MPIPAKPTLTAPPTAPVRSEDPTTFATKANALVAWYETNVTDLMGAIDWQDTVLTATKTEATNAASSATDSAASATEAGDTLGQTIATAALYTERHQGAHPSAPTTRNDGNPLQAGDFYFNSTDGKTYTWDGA